MEDIIDTKEMSHQLVKVITVTLVLGRKEVKKKLKGFPLYFFWSFSVFAIHLLLPLSKQ